MVTMDPLGSAQLFVLLDLALSLEQDLRSLEEWGARQEHDLAYIYEVVCRPHRYGRLWRPRRGVVQRDIEAIVLDVKRRLVRFERLTLRQERALQTIITRGGGGVPWRRRFVARASELEARESLYEQISRLERFLGYLHRWKARQGSLLEHCLTLIRTQRPAVLGSTPASVLADATVDAQERHDAIRWWR